MYNGANILVAGGAGFIGVNLIRRLIPKGCKIRATLYSRPPIITDESVEYIHADLTHPEDCEKAVEGMDYVFMCSANTSGAAVMAKNPLAHVTPNVVMNTQIMDAAYRAGVKKFVFISSCAAYPPTGSRPVKEDEMFDEDPYDVYYSVGWMKRYSEILCKMYAQKIKNPMPTLVIRPSNIYGPYDKFDFNTSHMTTALIRRVVERHDPIEVWGTGDDIRDLIYIEDFLDGLLLAFEKSDDYLAINIASGEGYSVKEILNAIMEVDGYDDAKVNFDPSKPSTIGIRLVDIGLAKDLLGFIPKFKLKEGLKRTTSWYRENRDHWDK